MEVCCRFANYIQEKEEMDQRPVFTEEGYTFVYIKYNNLYLMSVTKRNSNIALMLVYLYRLVDVFKVRAHRPVTRFIERTSAFEHLVGHRRLAPSLSTGLLRRAGRGEHPRQLRHHL